MKKRIASLLGLFALIACPVTSRAEWVAYNDYIAGTIDTQTSPNATTNDMRVAGGPYTLKSITDGTTIPNVTMWVTATGAAAYNGTVGASPNANSPLYNVFNGYCYFAPNNIQVTATQMITVTFSNLNPAKVYKLHAGAIRGGSNADRWTKCNILGADSLTPNHQQAADSPYGILTTNNTFGLLSDYEVAFNSGVNLCGDMVEWDTIYPGADGSFSFTSTQWRCTNSVVSHGTNTATFTPNSTFFAYAIAAFRLEEMVPPRIPPSILTQPLSQTNVIGDAATFSIVLTGGYPLRFQWYKDGASIADATNQSYTISNLALGDTGNYSVAVTNAYGYTISSNAFLSVGNDLPISIVTQPQSQAVARGQSITFSVEATGSHLQYQWQKNGSDIATATNASYSIASITSDDAGSYTVLITNRADSVLSENAVLTVRNAGQALFIARTNLSAADVVVSNILVSADFAVTVVDDRLANTNMAPGKALVVISASVDPANIPIGWLIVTNPLISFNSGSWSKINLCLNTTNDYGTFTNQMAINIVDPTLPLAAGLSGVTQVYTSGQDISWGNPGGNAVVVAVATNSGGVEFPVIFGYEKRAKMPNNALLTFQGRRVGLFLGDNGATALTEAGSNLVKAAVAWATSAPVTSGAVVISRQPVSITVSEGSPAGFSVNATGAPSFTYQWQCNGTNITSATQRSYVLRSPSLADDQSQFRVIVKQGSGSTLAYATSSWATLTVQLPPPLAITQQPASVMVDAGQSATLTVGITGGSPYFQWYHDGTAISGANSNTYSIANISSGDVGTYYVVVTNRVSRVKSQNARLGLYPDNIVLLGWGTNTWRFNTNGTDLGTGWRTNGYNDSVWPVGAGLFLGGNSISNFPAGYTAGTTIPITNTTSGKIVTWYFRNSLNFTNDPDDITLTGMSLIDDGAVYYLNGKEVSRENMPDTFAYNTWASASITTTTPRIFSIDPYQLRQGENSFAVEVHQGSAYSGDMMMGVQLMLEFIRPTPLAITNQPANAVVEATHPVTLSVGVSGQAAKYQWYKDGQVIPGATGKSLTLLNASANDAGAYSVAVSNFLSYLVSRTAYVSVLPDTRLPKLLEADGSNAPGNILLTFSESVLPDAATNVASYVVSNLTDGTCLKIYKAVMAGSSNVVLTTSPRLDRNNYIVFARNVCDLSTNLVENIAPVSILNNLISPFSYYDVYLPYPPYDDPCISEEWCRNNWQLPATWGNNDSLRGAFWSGILNLPVVAGWEISPSASVVNYFRAPFQFEGSPLNASIKWRHLVDSGAVFYLNCEELARFNMPTGTIYCTNVATQQITSPTWSAWIDLPFDRLQPTNLMAIELHSRQAWETHLCMAVDLQARIYSYAHGPILITRQPEDQTVFEGQPVTFQFMAVGPKSCQWFLNGTPVTPAADGSYVIPSAALTLNGSTLYAVATNDTSSVTTRVATVTVLPSQGSSGNSIQFSKVGGQTCLWWTGDGFVLESTDTLGASPAATVWTPIDTLGNKYYWITPSTSSNLFYRLRQ